MATSTAPAMIAFLVGIFTTAFDVDGVQVLYGSNPRDAQRQNLCITGVVNYDEESWRNVGAFKRQEIYKIDGFISQRTPGASVQEQCEAAWALAALVEQQLRPLVGSGSGAVSTAIAAAFPDGSAQIKNIEFKPISGTPFFTDEGQVYQIDFAVQITAVI